MNLCDTENTSKIEEMIKLKRKRIIIFVTIGILSLSTAAYAITTALNNNVVLGRYTSENGVIIKSPDEADRIQIKNSYDPKTGAPTEIFHPKIFDDGIELKVETTEITLVTKRWSENFLFDYYVKDGKRFVIDNTERGYSVTPFIDDGQYIIEYHNNLYVLDINKNSISMLLKDAIEGYDFFSDEFHDKVFAPTWGEKPVISSDKTKMIFYTNRNLFLDDNGNGEIWIKDLITGDEKRLGYGGYSYLSTGDDKCAYLQQQNNVICVDFKKEDIQIVFDKAYDVTAVKYPFILYVSEIGKLNIYNLETQEESVFTFKNLGAIRRIDTDKYDNILFTNQPDRQSSDCSIVALNPKTLSYKEMPIPKDTVLVNYSWIDGDRIAVVTKKIGETRENSSTVNLNEISTQN